MKKRKITIKYCAFNLETHEFFLCTSKTDLAKKTNMSVDTIRRRMASNSDFMHKEWYVSTNVEVIKQPVRNENGFM